MSRCPSPCAQEVAAFWVPGKGPESKALLDKPDMATLCPATGDKLKLKVGVLRRVGCLLLSGGR